jgi:hypothetical protein
VSHQTKIVKAKNAGLKFAAGKAKTVNAESSRVAVNGWLVATSPVPPPYSMQGS